MAQVTLYLDEEAAAKASGLSQSEWVTKVIRQKIADEWPPQVAALAGAWLDLPEAEELRRERGQDAPRENL
jgi:hypothetical protein